LNRNEIILRHVKKDGFGVEIGPSFNPTAPKRDGYKVHVIDHLCREDLVKKYSGAGVRLSKIEEVDYVWKGETYAELTGKRNFYDWIIASHVIEHTPDLIGFINACDEILVDGGVLALVIPDKRFCFDHFRSHTGIGKVIDAHLNGNTIHTPGTAAECILSSVTRANQISWSRDARGGYAFFHAPDRAKAVMNKVLDHGEMVDFHAWCFTPHSFLLMIEDLYLLGLIKLREIDFHPTSGCEFYVTLSRTGHGSDIDRLEMLKQIEAELLHATAGREQKINPISTLRRWGRSGVKRCVSILRNARQRF
jgi:hypothetical protein